jgi:hypothetical protein
MADESPGIQSGPSYRRFRCEHCESSLKIKCEANRELVFCPVCSRKTRVPPHERPKASCDRPGLETSSKELGRYALLRRIGKGGFGEVWEAHDPSLDRRVAVKLPVFGSADQKLANRFLIEAQAASRLTHPNIVSVFDVGIIRGQYYLALEYVDGQSLSTALRDQNPPMEFVANIALQLADALDYAHQERIIHRDVKLSNVVMTSDGHPKLVDFGLAKIMDADATQTVDGSILGTPGYMSPEQASGNIKQVGPLSDQYSLGVVLYRLLAGRLPFEGPHAFVLHQIIHSPPEPPSAHRTGIDRRLEAICLKAMAKAPDDRYRDCGELREDIASFLRDEEVLARPLSPIKKIWRLAKKFPRESIAAIFCLMVLMLGSGFSIAAMLQANQMNQEAIQAKAQVDKKIEESNKITEMLKEQLEKTELARNTAQESLMQWQKEEELASAKSAELQAAIAENNRINKMLEASINDLKSTEKQKSVLGNQAQTLADLNEEKEYSANQVVPEKSLKTVIEFLQSQKYAEAKTEVEKIPAELGFERNLLFTLATLNGGRMPSKEVEIPEEADVCFDKATSTFWVQHGTYLTVYNPSNLTQLCTTRIMGASERRDFHHWMYLPKSNTLLSKDELTYKHGWPIMFVFEYGEPAIPYAVVKDGGSWRVYRRDPAGFTPIWDSLRSGIGGFPTLGDRFLCFDAPETPFALKLNKGFVLFTIDDPKFPPSTRFVDRIPYELQKRSTPPRTFSWNSQDYGRRKGVNTSLPKSPSLPIAVEGFSKPVYFAKEGYSEPLFQDVLIADRYVLFLRESEKRTRRKRNLQVLQVKLLDAPRKQ